MTTAFTHAVPILCVNNLDDALAYYVQKLGFTERWRWPFFASVGRGTATVFLCERGQGQAGTWISIFMKDVMPLYEEYQQAGAIIAETPMNFPWGHCEFLVKDIDGNFLRMTGDKTGPDSEGYERTLRSQRTRE